MTFCFRRPLRPGFDRLNVPSGIGYCRCDVGASSALDDVVDEAEQMIVVVRMTRSLCLINRLRLVSSRRSDNRKFDMWTKDVAVILKEGMMRNADARTIAQIEMKVVGVAVWMNLNEDLQRGRI